MIYTSTQHCQHRGFGLKMVDGSSAASGAASSLASGDVASKCTLFSFSVVLYLFSCHEEAENSLYESVRDRFTVTKVLACTLADFEASGYCFE